MKKEIFSVARNEILLREQIYVDYHVIHSYPLHRHDFYEIELVSSSGCVNIINGVEVPVSDTVCFFYCPHTTHEYISSENNEIIVYNIAFAETFVTPECLGLICIRDFIFTPVTPSDGHSLATDIHALFRDFDGNSPTRRMLLRSRLETILAELSAETQEQNGNETERDNSDNANILRILSYISRHFTRRISVGELAAFANVSPKYFSSYFKKAVGITYIKYLTKLRMNYAHDLVTGSDRSLNQIATDVGYSSVSNFIAAFIRYHGTHPSALRQGK